MSKYIKYNGRLYKAVDSTKDEMYSFLQRAKEELSSLYNFISSARASQHLWEASGDKEQIESDRKFLKAAEERAKKLSKVIDKVRQKIKTK